MGRTIRLKGLDKVYKNLDRYEGKTAKIIDTEAKKLIANIVADGQRVAPVDTGFLNANIRTEVRRDKYSAISHAKYSLPVDKRKPFFTLQALKKLSKYIQKVKSLIRGL